MFIAKLYGPIMYPHAVILLLAMSSQCAKVGDANVSEYLVRKLRQTKVEIAKAVMQRDTESAVSPPYNVEWVNLWSQRLHSERTLMVSMFNKMCILEGNRLISVAVQPATNKTSSALQQVALIRQERLVKFAKSILWKSKLYLLVCHEDDNSCGLYTESNDFHLRHRQIIKDKGWPMDATFFTRANRLYLVVAQNTDQFPVSSVIYHWTGTYMDVIYRIMTVGAISVTAFNYKLATIIIFGQNERRQPDIGSEVYEFDENGIDLIQYLPTNGPISIHYYTHKEEIFLLVVNEFEASNVYWWDGDEFLHWMDLPNIVAPSLVNVAHFNGDTLFFVSYESYVTLYKVSSSEYLRLNLLELKNGETVVDMGVWIDERATLTLLLVTVDRTNLYRIEPWELRIKKIPKNGSTKETKDAMERCLSELEIRLTDRVTAMESLIRHTWPTLLPSSESINICALDGGNGLGKLVLRSGGIAKVDVRASGGILLAAEIETLAAGSSGGRTLVNSILEESRKTMKTAGANRLVGNVTIQNRATFQGLHINSIRTEYLNGRSLDLANSVVSSTRAQNFSNVRLSGRNITVRQLQIDRLCGVPFDYWLRNVNEGSDNVFLKNNSLEITGDTVLLRTGQVSFDQLNVRTINGFELASFFSDLFIPGQRQLIKGNVVQGQSEAIGVGDLVVETLNGVAQKDLITVHTNQSFDKKVFVKSMLIKNLAASKINGIAVSESAMVSKKNHIKGEVTIAKMRIMDELAIENPSKFPKFRPVQVYDEVTIIGNAKAETLVLEPYTNFVVPTENGQVAAEQSNILDSILESYWTKSSSQTIKSKVSLDAGLTVNELRLDYLNNLNVSEDVMLTTVREINAELASLEFMNFAASGWIVEETEDPAAAIPLWISSDDSLVINEELRIKLFGAQYLDIETFNGIPVVEIVNGNRTVSGPYEYPANSVQRFDSITVNERLEAEHLDLRFVNGRHEQVLRDFLQSDANYTLPYLRTERLTLRNVNFLSETEKRSEFHEFAEYLQKFTNSSRSSSINEISLLTVDEELLVEKNLQVDAINHMSTRIYLDDLVSRDFAVSSNDRLIIDRLIVHRNLTVNFLQGSPTDSLLESTFAKSRVQNLNNSRFSCYKITVDDLNTERINKRYPKKLVYTDSDIKFDGDVTFTNLKLSLDEDTRTRSLNGYPLDTLYTRLGEIPLRQVNDLTVRGNVAWDSLGHSAAVNKVRLGPLDAIIKSALVTSSEATARAPRVIYGQTRINSREEGSSGVFVRRMSYRHDRANPGNSSEDAERLQGIDMKEIIGDAVLDDTWSNEELQIANKKSFAEDLTASQLNVDGEIGIGSLDKWSIKDLNASVVRKESLSSVIDERKSSRSLDARASRQGSQLGDTMIFREDVTINKLAIRTGSGGSSGTPLIHGVPVSAIVIGTPSAPGQYLPNNTYLKHLEVKGNAFVKSLDNVGLDEFVSGRVTVHSNHQVHANLQFNGRVQVSQGAAVRTINGIAPSDLVINNSHEDQRIVGDKIFHDDIEIRGKTYAPSIAGVNFREEHDNGVLNYQNTEIFGDLIFTADVERPIESAVPKIQWQLNPAGVGFVNAIKLRSFLSDRDAEEERILQGIKGNESRLELSIARASNVSSQLPEIFYYFDSANDLSIDAANVDRVEVTRVGELTVLNMYASEAGSYCGLENDCPCRRQYVAEISSSDCDWRQVEGPRIVYNFDEPNGAFGVTVTTTSVSSSGRCSTPGDESSSEFTTISWSKRRPDNHPGANVTENALRIYGYLSDVEVFTQNDFVLIVLAIYYDPIKQSHETNSLIYLLDLATNEISLAQGIPTSHASGVRVFKIPSKGAHVLLTSSGSGERGKSSESLLYRFEPSTAKFGLLRTFTTGGSRHGKSVSQPKDEFLFLDDAATNTIHVYVYNAKWDNFYFYQSLYHDSMAPVTAIETLYAGEFRRSQVYVIVTTKHDRFFVYEYMYFSKFQIIAQKKVKGILTMVPFDVSSRRYVFAGTETNSTILRVIEQGQH